MATNSALMEGWQVLFLKLKGVYHQGMDLNSHKGFWFEGESSAELSAVSGALLSE